MLLTQVPEEIYVRLTNLHFGQFFSPTVWPNWQCNIETSTTRAKVTQLALTHRELKCYMQKCDSKHLKSYYKTQTCLHFYHIGPDYRK